jgi:hypothetical protein
MITKETRAHLMAARDDVSRAGDGHPNLDLALAAAHIDRALEALCPHLPVTRKTGPDERGRSLTTCYACGMSWYNHERTDQPEPHAAERQQAAYMASLEVRLISRARDHGFAYVTTLEGDRLRANELYQPGHTIHRFSTPSEDRSDAAIALQASLGKERAFAPTLAEDVTT